MYPAHAHNARQHGIAKFVVGAGVNRCVFGWLNGRTDPNQTALLTLDELREVRRRREAGNMGELQFTAFLERSPTLAAPPGLSAWGLREFRSDFAARESLARRPDKYARDIAVGFVSVLGVPVASPGYYSHSGFKLSRVFRGVAHPTYTTSLHFTVPPSDKPRWAVVARHGRDTRGVHRSPNAKVFGAAYAAFWWGRPGMVLLFVAGLGRAVMRADVPLAVGGLLVVANAAAIALVQFTGLDRYGTPFFPVMTAVGLAMFGPAGTAGLPRIHTTFAPRSAGGAGPSDTVV